MDQYEGLRISVGRSKRLAAHYAATGKDENGSALSAAARVAAQDPAPKSRTAPASAAPSAPKPPVSATTYSKADVDYAAASAAARERARIAAAFGAASSHGRERTCATLLASPSGFSAGRIAAFLADEPLDRDRTGNASQARAKMDPKAVAAADATWDRAYARDTLPRAPATASVWDRAYASAATPSPAVDGAPANLDVWGHAYAQPKTARGSLLPEGNDL